jgi:YhcH/YjgK/YiaL family protein
MILDHIDSAGMYGGLGERIAVGLALLKEDHVINAKPGRYEVQGKDLFYMVDGYTTQPVDQCRLEMHQKYMDIQFIISGVEGIGYAALDGLTVATPYNGEKDVAFYEPPADQSTLVLTAGMFAIFWPNEPHRPKICVQNPGPIRKIVVKIRME